MPDSKRIRALIAKPGLDGHDRGAKVVARALRDAGMEVVYTGIHQTPDMIAETASQEDVDVVGLSILAGAHLELVEQMMQALRKRDMGWVIVLVGGIVPEDHRQHLRDMGVAAVFGPGTSTTDIIQTIHAALSGD